MAKQPKPIKSTGKKFYNLETHEFFICKTQNEDGQPTDCERWIAGNTRQKVIDGLLTVIRYQNQIIDQQALTIRNQELDIKELQNK